MTIAEINSFIPLLTLVAQIVFGWAVWRATKYGPSYALQEQENRKAQEIKWQRRQGIFCDLMLTRHGLQYRLSWQHVRAINMIGIEYYHDTNKEGQAVMKLWKKYIGILNSKDASEDVLIHKIDECFTDLLHKISVSLGIEYAVDDIQNKFYRPEAHDVNAERDAVVKQWWGDVVSKIGSIPVVITNPPQNNAQNDSEVQNYGVSRKKNGARKKAK